MGKTDILFLLPLFLFTEGFNWAQVCRHICLTEKKREKGKPLDIWPLRATLT